MSSRQEHFGEKGNVPLSVVSPWRVHCVNWATVFSRPEDGLRQAQSVSEKRTAQVKLMPSPDSSRML